MKNDHDLLEANKAVVLAFWKAFSESRFDAALELLDADATWWVAGTTDISGTYTKAQFTELVMGVAEGTDGGIQVTPTNLTAEGDRVAMEAESYGRMKSGKIYNNFYHFQHVLRDGKLITVREYLDTQHVQDVFGADQTPS
ncbi:MAG: nuclear transport factor 2 family protein [Pseudomonadales bacterium]